MVLDKILNLNRVYAHKTKGKERETLEDHSRLCMKYFNVLLKEKKLDIIWDNFFSLNMPECSQEMKAFYLKILHFVVLFHDTGKINPAFQRIKMNNLETGKKDFASLNGANHSLFSAIIYLDYCFHLLESSSFKKKEKLKLKGIIYANSYVISRHHSDLEDMKEYASIFVEGGECYNLVEELLKVEQGIYKGPFYLNQQNVLCLTKQWNLATRNDSREDQIDKYVYMRLLYSTLVAADYYATTEYMNGVEITEFGNVKQTGMVKAAFEKAELTSKIRAYQKEQYGRYHDFLEVEEINVLRSELFLDAENTWKENEKEHMFFLEAPTGSGKSNASMNLSFQMLNENIQKIYYVYPFNTLVEQNLNMLKEIFDNSEDILSKIAVVNSITPIKSEKKERSQDQNQQENSKKYYQTALLDRQFLNYPYVLTTHISLFKTLFGNEKEALFGFLQIPNSVIVLDEIQSYKNTLWSEIIIFLKRYAELLNIKIIIMSATLPELDVLTGKKEEAVYLIKNREKYFSNPKFKERVKISYELLEQEQDLEMLYEHIKKNICAYQKVLVEFIKKETAYKFYRLLSDKDDLSLEIALMTGDDNQPERQKILRRIKDKESKGIILVATQVIEAGVDIDMDVGYKDISKLDSEEQFLGRINRSCKKNGKVYFFDHDSADKIYIGDIRKSTEFTLKAEQMRVILRKKNFSDYYIPVLNVLKSQWNENCGKFNLEEFFTDSVGKLNFSQVEKRMQLIDDDMWHVSIFLAREINLETSEVINGGEVWKDYRNLLQDNRLDYAEKQVKLSEIRSKMSYFIYEIKRNNELVYNDKIGDLIYLENGEEYFVDGKLDREMLEEKGSLFI